MVHKTSELREMALEHGCDPRNLEFLTRDDIINKLARRLYRNMKRRERDIHSRVETKEEKHCQELPSVQSLRHHRTLHTPDERPSSHPEYKLVHVPHPNTGAREIFHSSEAHLDHIASSIHSMETRKRDLIKQMRQSDSMSLGMEPEDVQYFKRELYLSHESLSRESMQIKSEIPILRKKLASKMKLLDVLRGRQNARPHILRQISLLQDTLDRLEKL